MFFLESDSLPTAVLDSEEDLSAQDLIDFSPVYRCLHIHSVLNAKEEFETYYRKQRRQQARLVLQSSANMHEDLMNFRIYLHSIAGFFVVENHVFDTAGTLANRAFLDEVRFFPDRYYRVLCLYQDGVCRADP